jgi:hypothetical protein
MQPAEAGISTSLSDRAFHPMPKLLGIGANFATVLTVTFAKTFPIHRLIESTPQHVK